jgi:nucleoside 2-deoxyribosyltransferase
MSEDSKAAAASALEFERQVAAIYRALGADVEHNAVIAGNQVDVLVRERTASGTTLRMAIETKAYTRPVGVDVTNSFAAIAALLRQRGLIDRAVLVSRSGFTPQARASADAHGVELLEYADLEQRARGSTISIQAARTELASEDLQKAHNIATPKRIFVMMPFADTFQDVYILGIRDVAEKLGYVVERADDIEHNDEILGVIQEGIRSADAIVADLTGQNPNVFYEVGFAHAIAKPTILIARSGERTPFDLQSFNQILYATIADLREKLERRLRETMGDEA